MKNQKYIDKRMKYSECEHLVHHLPESEILRLETKYPRLYDKKVIEKYIKLFRSKNSVSYLKNTKLRDISRISMIAYKENKFSFNELVSLHLVIAAWKEIILELTSWMLLHDFGDFEKISHYDVNQGIIIPTSKKNQIWKLPYDTLGVIPAKHFLRQETYISLCNKVQTAYGKHEVEPILKKFFAFNDSEWGLFRDLMEKAPEVERTFHLINLPLLGCYSSFLQHLPRVFKALNPIKLFYSADGAVANYDLYYNEALPIPTFTAIQNFMKVKAANNKRKVIELVPVFGGIGAEDIYDFRKNGAWPLGLYYPGASNNRLEKLINKHMNEIDHTPGNALGFAYHDIYHAVRQQEISENITEATFRLVELLQELAKSRPYLKSFIDEIIEKVSEGVLIHSYGTENSPFFVSNPDQKFGHIFHCKWIPWQQEVINYIVENMVNERDLWRQKYDLGPEDLLEPEKNYYQEYSGLSLIAAG